MEITQYARARAFVNFIWVAGWFYIVFGIAGFIASYFGDTLSLNFQTLIYTVILGVLALACSQLIKAVLDMADNTREILAELRKRNGS